MTIGYETREQFDEALDKLKATPPKPPEVVTKSCGCVFCDIGVELHEDAKGFHHVACGKRVACPQSQPLPTRETTTPLRSAPAPDTKQTEPEALTNHHRR